MKIAKKISSLVLALAVISSSTIPIVAHAQSNQSGVGAQGDPSTRINYLSVQAAITIQEVDTYLHAFMENYEVPTYRTCPAYNIGACRSVASSDLSAYRDTVAVFILEWSKYTPEFIEASGIEGVYFLMDLAYGGVTFSGDNNFYVNAAFGNQQSYPDYIQRVFHHEFFHIIDKKFPPNSDNDWAALNTPGFTYIGSAAYDTLPVKTDHPQPGFVHSYSTVSPDEDKAVLYEHLFFKSRTALLQGWAASDPYLTSKIQYMKNQLKALDSAMTDSYFTQMHDFDINSVTLPTTNRVIASNDQTSDSLFVFENQTVTLHGKRGQTIVFSGGTLKGTGEVGILDARSGARIAPGSSPGCLTAGTTTLITGASLDIEIGGNTVCSQYDQLQVNGFAIIVGATLNVSFLNSFIPAVGDTYTILSNDGNDAMIGTSFANLPEGATLAAHGVTFRISYVGGDGNDITLTTLTVPDRVTPGVGPIKDAVPTAPNTGLYAQHINPLAAAFGTIVASSTLIWLSRKYSELSTRK